MFTFCFYFSVKTSIPIVVAEADVGMLQYLAIEKEYWQDPEREQHRKLHEEEAYLESFFLAIRCEKTSPDECATIAKE